MIFSSRFLLVCFRFDVVAVVFFWAQWMPSLSQYLVDTLSGGIIVPFAARNAWLACVLCLLWLFVDFIVFFSLGALFHWHVKKFSIIFTWAKILYQHTHAHTYNEQKLPENIIYARRNKLPASKGNVNEWGVGANGREAARASMRATEFERLKADGGMGQHTVVEYGNLRLPRRVKS